LLLEIDREIEPVRTNRQRLALWTAKMPLYTTRIPKLQQQSHYLRSPKNVQELIDTQTLQ
jgi:hypothetical protein